MIKNSALIVAGLIFFVVSVLHLVRLVMKLRVTVGRVEIPRYLSIAGLIAGLILSLWMFMSTWFK